MPSISLIMAQINTLVGDFRGNAEQVLEATRRAVSEYAAPVLVFPELTLSGYPPEDLLLRPSVGDQVEQTLVWLLAELPPAAAVVIGYPRLREGCLYNMAGVLHGGVLRAEYAKHALPNYQVFDEKRYFTAGTEPVVVELGGLRMGLSICEDIWEDAPAAASAAAGAQILLNLNASPYHRNKQPERIARVAAVASTHGLAIVYVNQVGGQDELVFDGGSFALDANGSLCAQAPRFVSAEQVVQLSGEAGQTLQLQGELDSGPQSELAEVWQALVLGLSDYVNKNGFPGVVLGLSGGVDSALTLALAVDALGSERVEAVMMPFRYTAAMSIEDAAEQSRLLGVRHRVMSIEPAYNAFMGLLAEPFAGLPADTTEENLQARCRGVLLMSLSNKTGALVLTTGNKSELAVGYSTLYGDMAGGFDPIKDVPKMLVYALCHYRNSLGSCIPERVLTRPPSAELAPDQRDADSLPEYPVLDQILERYVEQDQSVEQIIAAGMARSDVERVVRLVDRNEYKRRQAPVGVRISRRGFGRDRRYPITARWRHQPH